MLVDLSLRVAEPLQENHTGMHGLVTMNLTITVFCEENFTPGFSGPLCSESGMGYLFVNITIGNDSGISKKKKNGKNFVHTFA